MRVKHALGYQNYEKLMDNHIFYVDKTDVPVITER